LKSFGQDDLTAELFEIILPLNCFARKLAEFFCPMSHHINCFALNSFAF
jgi:hypothetical protein